MEDKLYERQTEIFDATTDDFTIEATGAATWTQTAIPFQVGQNSTNEDFILSNIKLLMKKGVPALTDNLIVEIRSYSGTSESGTVGSDIYAREEIDVKSLLTTSYQWISLGGIGNPTLRASTKYCIVLEQVNNLDAYYIQITPKEGATNYPWTIQTSDNEGISFSETDMDGEYSDGICAFFGVYGGTWSNTVIDYVEVIELAGSGANSSAKKISTVTRFVQNAEGYVNALTRYDWGTNWASLETKARYLVKEAIMCLAAVAIVNYDATGYSSRFESQFIASALQQRADYAIAALVEQAIQQYIKS
jgi:hypothetical protein